MRRRQRVVRVTMPLQAPRGNTESPTRGESLQVSRATRCTGIGGMLLTGIYEAEKHRWARAKATIPRAGVRAGDRCMQKYCCTGSINQQQPATGQHTPSSWYCRRSSPGRCLLSFCTTAAFLPPVLHNLH